MSVGVKCFFGVHEYRHTTVPGLMMPVVFFRGGIPFGMQVFNTIECPHCVKRDVKIVHPKAPSALIQRAARWVHRVMEECTILDSYVLIADEDLVLPVEAYIRLMDRADGKPFLELVKS